jgi:hypothetical protein
MEGRMKEGREGGRKGRIKGVKEECREGGERN